MSIDPQENPETSRILGIDYGQAEIGLALADHETRMAFAFGKIKNDKDAMRGIGEIIRREQVRKVIIGIPTHVKRKEVEQACERLGRMIERETGIRVAYQNEMFTTKMAQANLIERGAKKIKRFDDAEAARIILQEWLDNNAG